MFNRAVQLDSNHGAVYNNKNYLINIDKIDNSAILRDNIVKNVHDVHNKIEL